MKNSDNYLRILYNVYYNLFSISLIEEGGDWDRRNRLKVYQGIYFLSIRDFKSAANNFLDSISTFTSYELMDYKTCKYDCTREGWPKTEGWLAWVSFLILNFSILKLWNLIFISSIIIIQSLKATSYPRHQRFPSQNLTVGASCK